MTIISIDDNLNIDKDHFKSLDEFMEYIVQQNILTAHEHLVKEEAIKYGNKSDEKAQLEQLSFIIEQLKQVKDFRLMERIKDIIQASKQEGLPIYQWQKDIVNKRLKDIENGNVKFLDFDDVINEIEKEL